MIRGCQCIDKALLGAFALVSMMVSASAVWAADEAEIQKVIEFVKKHEKDGSVKPSGYGWISADGESSVNLLGVIHFDARNIENGLASSQDKDSASGADNFEIRRARVGVNGTLYKDFDYEIITNLVGSSTNTLLRAYVNYNASPGAQVRVGRFKQPFSLEELTSVQGIDFMERSYGNQMVASNRNGVMLHGAPIKGMTYAVSAYQDGFNELSNTNQVGTLGAARITSNLAELGGISDTVIHFGAAFDSGKYEVTPTTSTDTGSKSDSTTMFSRATILAFRSEDRGMANVYRAQVAGDVLKTYPGYGYAANNNADISKNLQGLEFAFAKGPFKFQTEYFDNKYSVSSTSCIDDAAAASCKYPAFDLKARASYTELIYNITGESWANAYKAGAFTSVKPKANFNLGSGGGWGAWQVAIRYSDYKVTEPSYFSYSLDNSGVNTRTDTSNIKCTQAGTGSAGCANGFSRGENATGAGTWTLGLNWILNPNSRIMFNYADTNFNTPITYLSTSKPSTLGTTTREQIISVRTQLNF